MHILVFASPDAQTVEVELDSEYPPPPPASPELKRTLVIVYATTLAKTRAQRRRLFLVSDPQRAA
jgi:hypothetical protein